MLIFGLTWAWQGCDSGNGSSGGGGGGKSFGGGGSTATFLAYLDAVAGNVNVASIPTSGTLAKVTGSPYLAGSQPVAMAITPDGRFFYAVNAGSGNVNQYAIATDGTLTQPVTPIATGVQPSAMAIDPTERFALVTNKGDSTLSVYTMTATTGVLAASGSPIVLHITAPQSIALNGNFVFVASANAIDVLIYDSTTKTFSFGTGSSIGGGLTANIIALYTPPLTNRLFALDTVSNSLLTYTVNNTGVLTQAAATPVGTQPAAMVPDAANQFLFVANQGSSNISVFAVDPSTGALTLAATPLVTTEASPNALAYDPVNNFLFVSASGTARILTYAVTTTNGALTIQGLPFPVANAPAAMVVAKP